MKEKEIEKNNVGDSLNPNQETTPDQKALDLTSKISEKQKTATTEEDWQEIAKLFEELKAVYEPEKGMEAFEASLREQYENQLDIMVRLGITNILESGEFGIQGIDGKEYPEPTFEQVIKRIEVKKEMIEKKEKQGFTRLLLVPFGVKLEQLTEAYKGSILEHHKQGKLFTAKKDASDPNEKLIPLKLDENNPLYVWDGYEKEELIYWPKEFSENHGGKTKKEILVERSQKNDVTSGWDIIFVEDNPNIPRQGNEKTVGTRTQIDTKGSKVRNIMYTMPLNETIPNPEEYLRALTKESKDPNSVFQGEQGMTPEDQLMYAITYLEEHHQIIDDYEGNGSISYQIGGWFPASGSVPGAYWYRDYSQAYMDWRDPRYRNVNCGVRPSVRI